MNINWFPGHMQKTYRQMKDALKRVDYVVEVCDARCARSSRNPELAELTAHKDRLLLLNKSDLADPEVTNEWIKDSEEQGLHAIATSLHAKVDIARIRKTIVTANRERIERAKAKGYVSKPLRLMIVGIPNSGKSTLINRLAGKGSFRTQNKPGITRQLSWLRAGSDFELLDTPGVLWPKLETQAEQFSLASSGAIPDHLLPLEDVASWLLIQLNQRYPDAIKDKYGQAVLSSLDDFALSQKLLVDRGDPDLPRAAKRLLNDFRSGSLGPLSLERP